MQTFLLGKSMLNSTPAGRRKLGCGRGKQDPSTLRTKEVSLLNYLYSADISPGAREQQALSVSGTVSMTGSVAGPSLCLRGVGNTDGTQVLKYQASSPLLSYFLSPQSFLFSPFPSPFPPNPASLLPHFSILKLTFQFSNTEPSFLPPFLYNFI